MGEDEEDGGRVPSSQPSHFLSCSFFLCSPLWPLKCFHFQNQKNSWMLLRTLKVVLCNENTYFKNFKLAELDEQVASSLHCVLKPFLLRRIKSEVCSAHPE